MDADFMKLALDEAKKAALIGEVPVGAIITDSNGKIIARAHNLREMTNDATAHAEIIAIREANEKLKSWRLKNLTMYVTLEPCSMCAGAVLNSRIGRLVYGAADVKAGAVESIFALLTHKKLNADIEIRAGVLEDECKEILQKFFKDRRQP